MAKLQKPKSPVAMGLTLSMPMISALGGGWLGHRWGNAKRERKAVADTNKAFSRGALRTEDFSKMNREFVFDSSARKLAYPFPEDIPDDEGTVVLKHTAPWLWNTAKEEWGPSMDKNERDVQKWIDVVRRNQEIARRANDIIENYRLKGGKGGEYEGELRNSIGGYRPEGLYYGKGFGGSPRGKHGEFIYKYNDPVEDPLSARAGQLPFEMKDYPQDEPHPGLLPKSIVTNGGYMYNPPLSSRQDPYPLMYQIHMGVPGANRLAMADGGEVPRDGGEVPSYAKGGDNTFIQDFYDNFGGNFLGRRVRKGETEAIGALLGLPGFREDYEAKYGRPWDFALHEMLQGSVTPEMGDVLADRTTDAMRFMNSNNNLRKGFLSYSDLARSWFDQRSKPGSPLGYMGHNIGNWIAQLGRNLAPDQDAYADPTNVTGGLREFTYRPPSERNVYYETPTPGGPKKVQLMPGAGLVDRVKNYVQNKYNELTAVHNPEVSIVRHEGEDTIPNLLMSKPFNQWTEKDLAYAIDQKILPDPEKDPKGFDKILKQVQSIAQTPEGMSLRALYKNAGRPTTEIPPDEANERTRRMARERLEGKFPGQTITEQDIDTDLALQHANDMARRNASALHPYDPKLNQYANLGEDSIAQGTLKEIRKGKVFEPFKQDEPLPDVPEQPKMQWAKLPNEYVTLKDGRVVNKLVRVPVPPPAPRYDHKKAMDYFAQFSRDPGMEHDISRPGTLVPHTPITLGPDDKAEGSDVFTRDFGAKTMPDPNFVYDPNHPNEQPKQLRVGNTGYGEYANRFYRYDVRNLGTITPEQAKPPAFPWKTFKLLQESMPARYADFQKVRPYLPEGLLNSHLEPFEIPARPTNIRRPIPMSLRRLGLAVSEAEAAAEAEGRDFNIRDVLPLGRVPASAIRSTAPNMAQRRIDKADPLHLAKLYNESGLANEPPLSVRTGRTNPLYKRGSMNEWFASNPNEAANASEMDVRSPHWTAQRAPQDIVNPFPAKPGVKPPGTPYFNTLPYIAGRTHNAQRLSQQLNAAEAEDVARGLGHTGPLFRAPDFDVPSEGWEGFKAGAAKLPESERDPAPGTPYRSDIPRFPAGAHDPNVLTRHQALSINPPVAQPQAPAPTAPAAPAPAPAAPASPPPLSQAQARQSVLTKMQRAMPQQQQAPVQYGTAGQVGSQVGSYFGRANFYSPQGNALDFEHGGSVRRFDVGGVVPKYNALPSYEYGGYSDMIGQQLLDEAIPRYDAGGMNQMPFQQQFAKMEAGQLGSVRKQFDRAITDPRTGRPIDPETMQEVDPGYYQRQVMESYMNQHSNPQMTQSGVVDPTGLMPQGGGGGGGVQPEQQQPAVAPQIKARIPYYQQMYQKMASRASNPKGAMKNIVPMKTRV